MGGSFQHAPPLSLCVQLCAVLCRLLRPANPTSLLINSLLVISQLARSTHAHYDALAGKCLQGGSACMPGQCTCLALLDASNATLLGGHLLCSTVRGLWHMLARGPCSESVGALDAGAPAASRRQRACAQLQPAWQPLPAQVGRRMGVGSVGYSKHVLVEAGDHEIVRAADSLVWAGQFGAAGCLQPVYNASALEQAAVLCVAG